MWSSGVAAPKAPKHSDQSKTWDQAPYICHNQYQYTKGRQTGKNPYFKKAIEQFEKNAMSISKDEYRLTYLESMEQPYAVYIGYLLEIGGENQEK